MSFGITIEKYTYANTIIDYCQWPEFFEFFKAKEGRIEYCKRYFYTPDVLQELVDFLNTQDNEYLEDWIGYIEDELSYKPDVKYIVYFG